MMLELRHDVVAIGEYGVLDRDAFVHRVNGLKAAIAEHPAKRWGLVCEDSGWFIAAVLALTSLNRKIIIPPAPQPGSLKACNASIDAVVTDLPERFSEFSILSVADCPISSDANPCELNAAARIDFYSSGSSSALTAISFDFGQLLSEARELDREWGKRLGDALTVGTVPHYHRYGFMLRILWPLLSGRTFFNSTCQMPANLRAAMQGHECVIVTSPAFLRRVEDCALLPSPAHVRAVFSTGAPLPDIAARRLGAEWGQAAVEIYGSTETGGIAWRSWSATDERPTWQPLLRTQIELRAESAGDRLWVKSPATHDDWMATGDLARSESGGRFSLLGRADDVVKFEDKRVSLGEMRTRLLAHDRVLDARLILVEGARTIIGAVVVLDAAGQTALAASGKSAVCEELRAWLRTQYEPILIPRKWRFIDAWPDHAMGKVTHAFLQQLFVRDT